MLVFHQQLAPKFLEECVKVFKKEYQIDVVRPSRSRVVTNVLEGATYDTKDDDVILRGTVGEYWVAPMAKVIKTYVKLDGTPLTPADFRLDKSLKVKTQQGKEFNYAMRIPVTHQVQVNTAWGDVLIANRPEVEHGKGDYIVCRETDGKPDLNDVWIVNGKVFETTYSLVHKDDTKNDKARKLLEKAKNPNLSIPCVFNGEQFLSPSMTIRTLDTMFAHNRLKIQFIAEDTVTGETATYMFGQNISKDGKSICYNLNGIPIIIKPEETRYKTLKGCISGLFSATRNGDVLGQNGNPVILTQVAVGTSNIAYKSFLDIEPW